MNAIRDKPKQGENKPKKTHQIIDVTKHMILIPSKEGAKLVDINSGCFINPLG